jgi:4-amino-4-deoxy-L-arabinose transferase-like glycosyltransferase
MRPRTLVLIATVLGFALRLPGNGTVPPRWDEGWSIAHASLSISEILRITAADVHPPLFYLALGLWQMLTGHELFAARFLAVLMSTAAIPLIFVVAKAWAGSARLAVIAAFLMAWLPLGVYYGAVVRMYALAPAFVLLAAYGALKMQGARDKAQSASLSALSSHHASFVFVIGAAGAMLTLYHTVWALAAIALYGLIGAILRRQSAVVRRLLIAIGVSVLAYLPWAAFAVPQFLGRAAAESATNIGQQFPITYFIEQGIRDLTMSQAVGIAGVIVITLIVLAGVGMALRGLTGFRNLSGLRVLWPLALPLMMIAFTLLGVSIAARQWAFNARMLIGAVPALALLLAWAFEQMLSAARRTQGAKRKAQIARGLAAASALGLLVVYFTTSFDFVYRKTLEVFDPYNPNTYRENIAPLAQPDDRVFFNVLSPAGFYALDKQPNDPAWDYALTWDPVIEPRALWEQRIGDAAQTHHRLWLVLYRGLAGDNGDLRGWMDSTFFPAHSQWGEEEVFYGLYGVPRAPLAPQDVTAQWGDLMLDEVRVGTQVRAGDVIPVALTWRAVQQVPANYKVFVHAARPDGFVVAQHDAQPLNDLRPTTTWAPNEPVRDNHGLALPADVRGPLTITIGLYNPDTGERLKTADGRDAVEVAKVNVE